MSGDSRKNEIAGKAFDPNATYTLEEVFAMFGQAGRQPAKLTARFKGESDEEFEIWESAIEKYKIVHHPCSETSLFKAMVDSLDGHASTWFVQHSGSMTDSESLRMELKHVFCSHDVEAVVLEQWFYKFCQGGNETPQEYAAKFARLQSKVMAISQDKITIERFVRGLTEDLRETVRQHRPNSLQEALFFATNRYKALQDKGSGGMAGNTHELQEAAKKMSKRRYEPLPVDSEDIEMLNVQMEESEVEVMNVEGKLRCYRCGEYGHIKRSCNEKKTVCGYCKKSNHAEFVCRAKKADRS